MMNVAFLRRKAVEHLESRRVAMMTALHGNSAFYKVEGGPEKRDGMIEEFNDKCDEIIVQIYSSVSAEEIEKAEMEDPFLAAIADLDQEGLVPTSKPEEQE
jgi:hypothetical protein